MNIHSIAKNIILLSSLIFLAGCYFTPPDTYSTKPFPYISKEPVYEKIDPDKFVTRRSQAHFDQVSGDADLPRAGFVEILNQLCDDIKKNQNDPPCKDNLNDKDYNTWAGNCVASSKCVNAVVAYTIEQCITKTGAQNAVTARANIAAGTVLSTAAVAADVTAVINAGSKTTPADAALAAALASGTGNVQKIFPNQVAVKSSDLIGSAQAYVLLGGFTDDDLSCLTKSDKDIADDTTLSCVNKYGARKVELKYSRLHDVAFAACPVGAY